MDFTPSSMRFSSPSAKGKKASEAAPQFSNLPEKNLFACSHAISVEPRVEARSLSF